MTEADPNDGGAIHSALNDAEFPDDVEASRDPVVGGEGPEETAMHVVD